jgi:hypothetical protein
MDPYIHRLINEYIGLQGRPTADVWLTDEYKSFLLLPFFLPPQMGSLQTGRIYMNSHTQQQMHNIVYDTLKKNKFHNLKQYSSRQAKAKLKLRQAKAKLKLRRCDVAVGSSRRVEEGVNKVISLPAALL